MQSASMPSCHRSCGAACIRRVQTEVPRLTCGLLLGCGGRHVGVSVNSSCSTSLRYGLMLLELLAKPLKPRQPQPSRRPQLRQGTFVCTRLSDAAPQLLWQLGMLGRVKG